MTSPSDLTWVTVVAGIACAFMSWGIGANDVANSFGTAFGARCLTIQQATLIAAVCELAGAILMGGHVSETIRKGMMDVDLYGGDDGRMLIMVGMTSVLFAAATWLLLASKFGLPVSTTHSAVGGVIAFAICSQGYTAVKWEKVLLIIASWFISPAMSAVIACISYLIIIHLVLKHEDSFRRAKLLAPVLVFLMCFIVALFTVYKGGKGLGLHKTSMGVAIAVSGGFALALAAASVPLVPWYARRMVAASKSAARETPGTLEKPPAFGPAEGEAAATAVPSGAGAEKGRAEKGGVEKDETSLKVIDAADLEVAKGKAEQGEAETGQEDPCAAEWIKNGARDVNTERLFVAPVAIVAAFQSLAHGANDCANAVGPYSAVLAASQGELSKKTDIEMWVFFLAGGFIAIGLLTYGARVMATIGQKITPMNPAKAFCSQFAVFLVCLIATRAGIPISTTHAAVGSVIGVGLAEGVRKIDWKLMANVAGSWIVTLPIVGLTASGIFGMFLPAVWVKINLTQG